ncbi:MAG: DUF2339 domain-containing protein, partial [Candidatus Wallbacteria bacterium]|nr:DUF2339 domain-containing protein [Candidatus Wallbacteria bacterium]
MFCKKCGAETGNEEFCRRCIDISEIGGRLECLSDQLKNIRNGIMILAKDLDETRRVLISCDAPVTAGARPPQTPENASAQKSAVQQKAPLKADKPETAAVVINTVAAQPVPKPAAGIYSGSSEPRLEMFLGQKGLLAAGVIAVIFSVGYFLKYSFDRNWISEQVRVLMSFILGAGFLFGGEHFRRQGFRVFGLYLLGGG